MDLLEDTFCLKVIPNFTRLDKYKAYNVDTMSNKDNLILYLEGYVKVLERECENQARILLTRLNIKTPHDTVVLGDKLRKMISDEKGKS